MRKLILLLIILCFALQVRASECTAYLCEIYSNEYNSKVKIVSKKELCIRLWGTEEFIDENALQVNFTRLRKTLREFGLEERIETCLLYTSPSPRDA